MDFHIGQRVQVKPGAEVPAHTIGREGVVEGYEQLDDDQFFVVVKITGGPVEFDQWFETHELDAVINRPAKRG